MLIQILTNKIVLSCFFAWFITQLIKVMGFSYDRKKFRWNYFTETGGMPSSHTSLVVALTLAVILSEGITTLAIACFVFAAIVIRDSYGVRRQTGEHAQALNKIIRKLQLGKKIGVKELKELMGHTPLQILIGGIIGIVITVIVFLI